jgi:trans-aconitate 2-methyltransferase
MTWEPDQYPRFFAERSLPFHQLVASVGRLDQSIVLDLGCGTGHLTATLFDRESAARVIGIDSPEEMIGRARNTVISERLRSRSDYDLNSGAVRM